MIKHKNKEIYNAASNMKASVLNFAKRMSNGLKKTNQKFIGDMLYGIMAAQDVKLTEVGKTLKEDMKLKYTEERLRRNVNSFDDTETVTDNYMKRVIRKCRKDTILLVDKGVLSKPCGSSFEGLCEVCSPPAGGSEKGFPTVGIIALTDNKLPVNIYEKIYSYKKDFISENHETFKALEFADRYFGKHNIRVLYRGYDSSIITEELLNSEFKFMVRLCESDIISRHRKNTTTNSRGGGNRKYIVDFENPKARNAQKMQCEISITQIELERFPGETFTLVIYKDDSDNPVPMITNVIDNDEAICDSIVKCCLMRARIEAFYRFKKRVFKFEDIRVMSLKSMNNINLFLNILIGFLSMKSTEGLENPPIVALINKVKQSYETMGNVSKRENIKPKFGILN